MNKIIKVILIGICIVFLSLYFSNYNNNYYETKTYLTEEAIKEYENDLKKGKSITSKNYIPKEKNYNNKVSEIGIKASAFLDKIINKSLKYLVKYLD